MIFILIFFWQQKITSLIKFYFRFSTFDYWLLRRIEESAWLLYYWFLELSRSYAPTRFSTTLFILSLFLSRSLNPTPHITCLYNFLTFPLVFLFVAPVPSCTHPRVVFCPGLYCCPFFLPNTVPSVLAPGPESWATYIS